MSNSNPIDFTTASPVEIAKWQSDYEENMHTYFVEHYGNLMNHPARLPSGHDNILDDTNSREVCEGVINQSLYYDLSIYDKADDVTPVVFGMWVHELTSYTGTCYPNLQKLFSTNPDRQYFFAFKTRKDALDFIMEMTLADADDSV